jgi:ribonuclease P protein component
LGAGRPDRSFPRDYRLASSGDFRRVYRSAWRGRTGLFGWHARRNGCGHARLGLAVPKKVVKKATDRSRVKRLVRESFRHNRDQMPAVDIVVSVKALPPDFHDPKLNRLAGDIWMDVLSAINNAPQRT